MLKFNTKQIIDCSEWDDLVEETYGRTYCFQQQDGCQPRGTCHITIPDVDFDYENDTVPEKINGDEYGVSFKAWLDRDPKQPFSNGREDIQLWWQRNFYPELQTVANDLHNKGLIPAGEYVIEIDW